jgi:hypothetical protein
MMLALRMKLGNRWGGGVWNWVIILGGPALFIAWMAGRLYLSGSSLAVCRMA